MDAAPFLNYHLLHCLDEKTNSCLRAPFSGLDSIASWQPNGGITASVKAFARLHHYIIIHAKRWDFHATQFFWTFFVERAYTRMQKEGWF